MIRKIIYFVGLVNHTLIIGCIAGAAEYEFKKERVLSVSRSADAVSKEEFYSQNFLKTLNVEQPPSNDLCKNSDPQSDLCELVRDRNSLSTFYYSNEGTDLYDIKDLNGNVKTEVAIHCSTVPDVWVRLGSSNSEMILTFLQHEAENYSFVREFVESIKRMPASDYEEHHWSELQKSKLATFEHRDCDYFCFWAHERVEYFSPEQRSKNLDDSIIGDKATFFQVDHEGGKKEDLIAIRCRTEPEMYLRLKTDGNKELIVMFLEPKTDPPTELKTDPPTEPKTDPSTNEG